MSVEDHGGSPDDNPEKRRKPFSRRDGEALDGGTPGIGGIADQTFRDFGFPVPSREREKPRQTPLEEFFPQAENLTQKVSHGTVRGEGTRFFVGGKVSVVTSNAPLDEREGTHSIMMQRQIVGGDDIVMRLYLDPEGRLRQDWRPQQALTRTKVVQPSYRHEPKEDSEGVLWVHKDPQQERIIAAGAEEDDVRFKDFHDNLMNLGTEHHVKLLVHRLSEKITSTQIADPSLLDETHVTESNYLAIFKAIAEQFVSRRTMEGEWDSGGAKVTAKTVRNKHDQPTSTVVKRTTFKEEGGLVEATHREWVVSGDTATYREYPRYIPDETVNTDHQAAKEMADALNRRHDLQRGEPATKPQLHRLRQLLADPKHETDITDILGN